METIFVTAIISSQQHAVRWPDAACGVRFHLVVKKLGLLPRSRLTVVQGGWEIGFC